MSKEIDEVVEREDAITAMKIEAIRNAKDKGPRSTGFCLFCRERVAAGERWCDSDCRDDWDHERRMKRL
ncbi:MAG: hypothetical protein CME82_11450 [Halomonas sp.]|nr:hypothetical protein [Halomonas sp.]|tara:strand:- start:12845 stop:13051 length:207 start_codon:yes stop_codon:yes gene_type:complete